MKQVFYEHILIYHILKILINHILFIQKPLLISLSNGQKKTSKKKINFISLKKTTNHPKSFVCLHLGVQLSNSSYIHLASGALFASLKLGRQCFVLFQPGSLFLMDVIQAYIRMDCELVKDVTLFQPQEQVATAPWKNSCSPQFEVAFRPCVSCNLH